MLRIDTAQFHVSMHESAPRMFGAHDFCKLNHVKEVYMANILPMTDVKGIMIHNIHLLTMVHIIYTILCGQVT